jgi:hypothetical protein
MNWRRGLIRLWLVASVLWIAANMAALNTIDRICDPLHAYSEEFKINEAKAAGYSDDETANYLRMRAIRRFAEIGISPPIGAIMLGAVGLWVTHGFRRQPSN